MLRGYSARTTLYTIYPPNMVYINTGNITKKKNTLMRLITGSKAKGHTYSNNMQCKYWLCVPKMS